MKKFELTNQTIYHKGSTLYQIKALKDFDDVKAGDFGGFVEMESNLSHKGDCWIYGRSKVFDNARIEYNGKVFDEAEIYERAQISGDALIGESAKIYGNCVISGNSKILGCSDISGNVKIEGNAEVNEYCSISGDVILTGRTVLTKGSYIRTPLQINGSGFYLNTTTNNSVYLFLTNSHSFNYKKELDINLINSMLKNNSDEFKILSKFQKEELQHSLVICQIHMGKLDRFYNEFKMLNYYFMSKGFTDEPNLFTEASDNTILCHIKNIKNIDKLLETNTRNKITRYIKEIYINMFPEVSSYCKLLFKK